MKKLVFFLVVVIFVVSAVLGFQAAEKWGSGRSGQAQAFQDIQIASTQKNYLLVHITDLGSGTPQLVSVWGLMVFYSQPPQVMLLPLYPSYDDATSAALGTSFKIDSNGKVSPRFINEIEKRFDLVTTGYITVDNAGLSLFNKWLTQEEVQISAATPSTADEKHIVLLNGQQFFQKACGQFSQQGAKGFMDQIRWMDLIPLHFSTNLSFESIALASDYFKTAGNINQCAVLSDE